MVLPDGLVASKVIAVHLNYRSRAEQRGRLPVQPSYFLKPPSSLSRGGAIVRPKGAALCDAFAAADHERARALHCDLHPLVAAAFIETNPVPIKWAMEQLGLLGSGTAREPLSPLSAGSQARVRDLLAQSPHIELSMAVNPSALTPTRQAS